MFNLNIPTSSFLSIDSNGLCTTPKTPEILNSLIAMTNPLDTYQLASTEIRQQSNLTNNNQQNISQDSCHSNSSGSPLESPAGQNSTQSIQKTCSQLIKAGLKLSIQSKRKMSSCDSSSGNEHSIASKSTRKSIADDTSEEDDSERGKSPKTGLTPEDEDRRRRRRERNKIAATKCRMKKRERTLNLVSESEQLETQNIDLKSQVRNLEKERKKLFDMLQNHSTSCIHPNGYCVSSNLCQSPAYKYLNELGLLCDQQNIQNHQNDKNKTVIPSMNTIRHSRNILRRDNDILTTNYYKTSNTQIAISPIVLAPVGPVSTKTTTTTTSSIISSNKLHDIDYINSPTQTDSITSLQSDMSTVQHLSSGLIKSDYIPNCENSNGGTTVDSVTDFVLKHELVDAQSPYTTVQSADRFLFETNCESFNIKHSNNNNNNINNNNNNIIDYNPHLSTTPTNCTSYDNLLIKNDFLVNDSELLAQLTDGTDSEFTDLDSGITAAYSQLTNGGCLA